MQKEMNKKILLVEDETLIAMHEQIILEDYGYSVMVVSSGESAIVSVQNTPDIDLILMDINLGDGIDGTEAARQILAEHDIPLVFLSSHTEREVVEKTEGITSYGYIVKNSGETVLIASIKMAFRLFNARMKEKEKEQELEKSEENLLITLNSIGDGVIVTDNDGKVVRMNPVAEVLCGWSQSEARGKALTEVFRIFHSITREPVKDPVRVVLEKGQIVGLGNHTVLLARDGKEYQISDSAAPIRDKNGKTIGIVLVFSDVTESYNMRRKIEESEEKYRLIVEKAYDGIEITQQDKIIFCNPQFARMLGYSIEELQQISFSRIFTEEATRELYERQKRRKAGKPISHNYQATFRRKDGSVIDVDVNYEIIDYQGKPATFAIIRDITERKLVQNKLIESEHKYKTLADYGQALIWTSGLDKKCDYFNKPWLEFTGRTLQQELGDGWVEGVHPDDLERCIEIYSNAFDRREHFSMDYRLRYNSGEYRWIQDDGTPRYDSQGHFIGYIGHCLDINDRKQAEKELKKRELVLNKILDVLPVGLWFADQNGKLLRGNPEGIKIWGAEPKVSVAEYDVFKARRLPSREEVAPEDWALVHTIREGVTIKDELLEIEAFDGVTRIIRNYTVPVYNDEEKLLGAIIVNNDVTRQYQSEKALKESEEKFRKLAESVGAILWEYDIPTDRWTYVAPQAESILGYKPDEWKDLQFWADKIHPNDKNWATEYCAQCTKRGEDHVFEYRFIKKNRDVVWLRDNVKVEVKDRKPVKLRGFMTDITEYKDAEEKIQTLLREKELLLKETHHRIKNNMGTVKSLLNLQAHSTDHPDSRKILKDAASRVQSMMVLYDKLYRSKAYDELNIKDFLPPLIQEIMRQYPNEKPVNTQIELDNFILDAKTLSSLGIILNECITNSMKYAFQATEAPLITVKSFSKNGKFILSYEDNGSGFVNPVTSEETQSFGLRLIEMLVGQLNGEITMQSRNGMKTEISFSPPKERN